jgi:hypothetical protein
MMNSEQLYKLINICRRVSTKEAVVYRCFEVLPDKGFVVQSADRIWLPFETGYTHQHERQLWELFCETAPEERSQVYPSLEEAIAAFDKEFEEFIVQAQRHHKEQ